MNASTGVFTRAASCTVGGSGREIGVKAQNWRSSSLIQNFGTSAGSSRTVLAPRAIHCSITAISAGVRSFPFFGISPPRTRLTISLSSGRPGTMMCVPSSVGFSMKRRNRRSTPPFSFSPSP